jgi:hypothetical protein
MMTLAGHEMNALRMRLAAAPLPPLAPSLPAPVFPAAARTDPRGLFWIIDTHGHRLFIFNPQLALVAAPGGEGGAPAQFRYPTDAAFSPAGTAFIADSWNHRIQAIDTNTWQLTRMFGGPGNDPGRLLEPRGVLFADGRLIVSERENHRLSFFSEHGSFLHARSRLPGLRQPLTYPGCMIRAGRHIVLLAEPQQALVLDAESLYCENSVSLAALPAPCALYPATDNAFMLSTLDGALYLIDLRGVILHSARLGDLPPAPAHEPPGQAALAVLACLPRKRAAAAFVIVEPEPAPGADRISLDVSPLAFALSEFKTAVSECDQGNQASCGRAQELFAHHAASPVFHAAAPSLAPALVCARSVDLLPAAYTDSAISCATTTSAGEFIVGCTPRGLARITEHGAAALPEDPGPCRALAALPGGALLAAVRRGGRDMLAALSPDGKTLRKLGAIPPQDHAPAPCPRDARTFFMPEPNAHRVTIRDLETGRAAGALPASFRTPVQALADPRMDLVFVLEGSGRITAMRESGEILWRAFPGVADEERAAQSLTLCGAAGLFAVLAPRNARTGDFSRVAQIHPRTGRVIRSFDHFADPDAPGGVIHCEDLAPILFGPGGLMWVAHKIERRAYGFDVSGLRP